MGYWFGFEGSDVNAYTGSNDDEVHKIDSDGNREWTYTGHGDDVQAVAVDPGLYGAFPDAWGDDEEEPVIEYNLQLEQLPGPEVKLTWEDEEDDETYIVQREWWDPDAEEWVPEREFVGITETEYTDA